MIFTPRPVVSNMASVAPRVAEAEERTGVVMPAPSLVTSMPDPQSVGLKHGFSKERGREPCDLYFFRGEDMPSECLQRKSAVVNLNHKVSLPADGSQNPERIRISPEWGRVARRVQSLNDDSQNSSFRMT